MRVTDWFTGVVEDVNDPLQIGRVRVRAFEYHTPSQSDLPTEDLPWATCIMPVTSASMSGIGSSATGLLPGSWVMGFFRDGLEKQDMVITGSIPSFSAALSDDRNNGFSDPHGFYPNEIGPDAPAGSNSFGYGANDAYNESTNSSNAFKNFSVGRGGVASTLQGDSYVVQANSAGLSRLLEIARGEIGVVETSTNQGPGISKYWSATDYTSGYSDRASWCAAFTTWCIQQAGIFSEDDRPKTASAFKGGGFESWAQSKAPTTKLNVRPKHVNVGDIVIFSFSHIGIASTESDINGKFKSIDGNTGDAVREKNRKTSMVRSSITIG